LDEVHVRLRLKNRSMREGRAYLYSMRRDIRCIDLRHLRALGGAEFARCAIASAGLLRWGLVALGTLLEGRTWGLAAELPRLALLAAWPWLVARWSGYAGFIDELAVVLPLLAIASLPMLLLAWRGTRALHVAGTPAAA
jgi:hypothetical protein